MARKNFEFTVLGSDEEAEAYRWYRRKHWESENFLVLETSDWGVDWKIFRAEEPVVGVTKGDHSQNFFVMGDAADFQISLEREPNNKFDRNAIRVIGAATVNGRRVAGQLGYLAKETAKSLQGEDEIDARPHSVWLPYGDCSYGLRITILIRSKAFKKAEANQQRPPLPPRRNARPVCSGEGQGVRATLNIPGPGTSHVSGLIRACGCLAVIGLVTTVGFIAGEAFWLTSPMSTDASPHRSSVDAKRNQIVAEDSEPVEMMSHKQSQPDRTGNAIVTESDTPPNDSKPSQEPETETTKPRVRTWHDKSGTYAVEAEYKWHTPVKVCLIRVSDGKEIKVDLERLCDDDVTWIKKQMKK